MRHAAKSQIKWSNNWKRQSEVADTATLLIGVVVIIALCLGMTFGAGQDFYVAWTVGGIIAGAVVFGLFAVAQLAFKIAGIKPVY